MLAEKLGINPEMISQIKEDFEKKMEMKEEMKEGEDKKVDIAMKVKVEGPSDEEVMEMEKDELISLVMKMRGQPTKEQEDESGVATGQKNSPFVVMMKKKGY